MASKQNVLIRLRGSPVVFVPTKPIISNETSGHFHQCLLCKTGDIRRHVGTFQVIFVATKLNTFCEDFKTFPALFVSSSWTFLTGLHNVLSRVCGDISVGTSACFQPRFCWQNRIFPEKTSGHFQLRVDRTQRFIIVCTAVQLTGLKTNLNS